VAARVRTLIFVDIVYAIITLICGTITLSSLVRYAVISIHLGYAASWTWVWIGVTLALMIIAIIAFRKIDHAPIRMLVVILLFVPQILNLLLNQVIPFPEVWFLNS
jgi:hypothetical protein